MLRSRPLEGSLRGHIGMRSRRLRSQHPDRPRCNISAPGQRHKDKVCARTWSSPDLPFAISFFKSIFLFQRKLLLRHHSLHSSLQTSLSLTCKLFFAIRLRASRKACPRRDTQSACGRARNISAPIWDWHTRAQPMDAPRKSHVFPVLRRLAPRMLCYA
jgi:hypothetical protein